MWMFILERDVCGRHGGGLMSGNGRVVITGMGVLAPTGIGIRPFWEALLEGRSGIGPVTLFNASDLRCRIAGEVVHFDAHRHIGPDVRPRRMGRFTQLGLAAVRLALESAGLCGDFLRRYPLFPIVMGVSTSAMDLRALPARAFSGTMGIPGALGSAIAARYGLHARLRTVSDACGSGLDAVAAAADLIRRGESEIALAGSAEGPIARYV